MKNKKIISSFFCKKDKKIHHIVVNEMGDLECECNNKNCLKKDNFKGNTVH